MISTLPRHHGRNGGLIAVGLLVTTTVVVWTTNPAPPAPDPEPVTQHIGMPQAVGATPPAATLAKPAASVPLVAPTAKAPDCTSPPARDGRLTATGFASYDEHRTSHLAPPVHGWMRKTRASSLGRKVRAGEALAVIYSPDVYFATVALLDQLRDFHDQAALDSERIRLLRWGMPKPLLDRIEATRTPQGWLPVVSRVPGIVVAEAGQARQLVDPSNRELFTVTDPSFSLVFVQVPDADAARVTVGTPAKLTIEGIARPLTANVSYVFRRSEDGMRTVRIDLHTPGLAIPAGARVTAALAPR